MKILMGNEAMARALLENGCTMATSYPGTPASEIMGSLQEMARAEQYPIHAEWSINEKVAYETALAHAYCGGRAAVSMKQVGLNVASDPFFSSAYIGVKGGFVVISADDPGPHSSQTEQDSRLMAMLAKVPVLDPASPREAKDMVGMAMALSEEYQMPILVRPTTRICHARQNVECPGLTPPSLIPSFERNPGRWAATPKFRLVLHRQLNEKLARISGLDLAGLKALNETGGKDLAIVTSGVVAAHAVEALQDDPELATRLALFQVLMPYPLNVAGLRPLLAVYRTVLILEESAPVMEMQMAGLVGTDVVGRRTGFWPAAGELTPDIVYVGLRRFAGLAEPTLPAVAAPGRRPTLCAGCGHRASFYALKEAMPDGIYPSDIGCYTLGMNMGGVDTCLCMGGAISMATGFDYTFRRLSGRARAIGATIGDSTFFHAGLPALINAVAHGASFVLMVLDNGTTAMTGHQPTPALERFESSGQGQVIPVEEAVRACGVKFIRIGDPYDYPPFLKLVKEAADYARDGQGVAVVISRRPCVMDKHSSRSAGPKTADNLPTGTGPASRPGLSPPTDSRKRFTVTAECTGCGSCQDDFGCPALIEGGNGQMTILDHQCVGCGVCVHVCPAQAIQEA